MPRYAAALALFSIPLGCTSPKAFPHAAVGTSAHRAEPQAQSRTLPPPEVLRSMERVGREGGEYSRRIRELLREGNLRRAEAVYREAAAWGMKHGGRPDSAHLYQLGLIRMAQGRYRDALPILLASRRQTGRKDEYELNIALCYVRTHDLPNARRFYSDDAILRYLRDSVPNPQTVLPGTDTAKRLEGSILLAKGLDLEVHASGGDALDMFTAAEKLIPDSALLAYRRGTLLVGQKRYAEAIRPLRLAASKAPGNMRQSAKAKLIAAEFGATR